jgi:hypothetical protein
MQINELIGKRITNIYSFVVMEDGGLDRAECFIELDSGIFIEIPYDQTQEVTIKDLDTNATSLFTGASHYPVYHVNKGNKTIGEIANEYQKEKNSFFNRVRKLLFGYDPEIKEYLPYRIDYEENKLNRIRGQEIRDFIGYNELGERGYLLLDNGYLISETNTAPNGTGLAGLNYFESLAHLVKAKGNDFTKFSGTQGADE